MAQDNRRKPATVIPSVPEGFAVGHGPDGKEYLVPQFMVPSLNQAFQSYARKVDLAVANASSGSLQMPTRPQDAIGENKICFPPNPDFSNQERLALHAEVRALQDQLGISYKDAAHRLYIAAVEKVKVEDRICKALQTLDKRMDEYIKSLDPELQNEQDMDVDS